MGEGADEQTRAPGRCRPGFASSDVVMITGFAVGGADRPRRSDSSVSVGLYRLTFAFALRHEPLAVWRLARLMAVTRGCPAGSRGCPCRDRGVATKTTRALPAELCGAQRTLCARCAPAVRTLSGLPSETRSDGKPDMREVSKQVVS